MHLILLGISRMDPRLVGTLEESPADLGPEIRPNNLVIGEVYYYIAHPDTPVSNSRTFGRTLPHKYHKGIFTGTRPFMSKTAYMKRVDATGSFDDFTLVSMMGHA